MQKRGGYHDFSFKIFLSHSTDKFRWGTLRCIRKFRVSKKFMHQRGGGGYHVSPSKIFCHTVPKNFVREHFGVSENFGYRKNYMHQRGGGVSCSPSKTLSHSTEKFRWGTLRCFRKFCVSQNFMHKKGISLNSVEKFLSHSANKIHWRTLLCFERILVSKIFKQKSREASRFCRNFFSHRTEKTSPGNHSVFQKISGREKNLWIRGGGITIFRRKVFVSLYQNISLENTFAVQKNSFIENFHA